MKNKNKLFSLIILLVCLIGIVLFSYNNDFIYQETIMKITNIKVLEKSVSTNTLGLEEKYYKKQITGIITNGNKKNTKEKIEYDEAYSSVVTEKYNIGDKVFISNNSIDGLKRDSYITLMVSFFLLAIFIVGNFRGLLAVVSVVLNTVIFCFGLDLYFKGVNLLFLCMLQAIIFTCLSLFLAGGKNKKTMAAIISTLVSIIILFIITFIVIKTTNYKGINFNEIDFLTVPFKDVILAELMIGGLGAIMDICITMSSSISELVEKDNKISLKALKKSGKDIGKDIMSPMINVIFFTYLCSGLPVFVLAYRNGFSFLNYIKSNFSLELARFLVGSIGILLAIPISHYISIKIFKRGDINE
jgi:uncharacterized membrane protein